MLRHLIGLVFPMKNLLTALIIASSVIFLFMHPPTTRENLPIGIAVFLFILEEYIFLEVDIRHKKGNKKFR